MSERGSEAELHKIIDEVGDSKTDKAIKISTQEALKKSREILDKAHWARKERLKTEYEDVRAATIASLQELHLETWASLEQFKRTLSSEELDGLSNHEITAEESQRIQKELQDMESPETVPKKSLEDTDISNLSVSQAQEALGIIKWKYKDYPESSLASSAIGWMNATGKLIWNNSYLSTRTINQINSRASARTVQDELIATILGNSKWYGNGFLKGNSLEQGGNYIVNIEEFKSSLSKKSINEVNSLALQNYFLYLHEKGELTQGRFEATLIKIFWSERIIELSAKWKKALWRAWRALEGLGYKKVVDKVVDTWRKEFFKLQENLGNKINIDLSSEVDRAYLLGDVKKRFVYLNTPESIVHGFKVIKEGEKESLISLSNVAAEHRWNKQVLEAFPIELGNMDVNALEESSFQNSEIVTIILKKSRERKPTLIKLEAVLWAEKALKMILEVLPKLPQNLANIIRHKESIPLGVQKVDTENTLGIKEKEEIKSVITKERFGINVDSYIKYDRWAQGSIGLSSDWIMMSPVWWDFSMDAAWWGNKDNIYASELNEYIEIHWIEDHKSDIKKMILSKNFRLSDFPYLPQQIWEDTDLAATLVNQFPQALWSMLNSMRASPQVLRAFAKGEAHTWYKLEFLEYANFVSINSFLEIYDIFDKQWFGRNFMKNQHLANIWKALIDWIGEDSTISQTEYAILTKVEERIKRGEKTMEDIGTSINTIREMKGLEKKKILKEIRKELTALNIIPSDIETIMAIIQKDKTLTARDLQFFANIRVTETRMVPSETDPSKKEKEVREVLLSWTNFDKFFNYIKNALSRSSKASAEVIKTSSIRPPSQEEQEAHPWLFQENGNIDYNAVSKRYQAFIKSGEKDMLTDAWIQRFIKESWINISGEKMEKIVKYLGILAKRIQISGIARDTTMKDSEEILKSLRDGSLLKRVNRDIEERIRRWEIDISNGFPLELEIDPEHDTEWDPKIEEEKITKISIFHETAEDLYKSWFSEDEIGDITVEEMETISKSQEALKGFIRFKKKLTELRMQEFWEYRNDIFKWIQSKGTNIWVLNVQDNDYLSEQELSVFLYTIAESVSDELDTSGKTEFQAFSKGNRQNIKLVTQLLRSLNKQDSSVSKGGEKTIMRDERHLGALFRKKYYGDDKFIFNNGLFLKSIH